ncbi:c-type cytochrome [bacterium]|nr:c-type cytochrome [bacterium]
MRFAVVLCIGLFSSNGYAQSHADLFAKVQTIFNNHCVSCHGSDEPTGGMSLVAGVSYKNIVNVPSNENGQLRRIAPNAPTDSYLFRKILQERERWPFAEDPMPLDADKLSTDEINTIKDWINSFPQDVWGAAKNITVADNHSAGEKESFLATQLINLPTTRTLGQKTAEFRILHRFGLINGGGSNTFGAFFGLDNGAFTSINLSLALRNDLDILVRRTGPFKDIEVAVKYVPVKQKPGMPVSLGFYAGFDWLSRKDIGKNRFAPNIQILAGSQLSKDLSILAVPSFTFKSNHNETVVKNGTEYKDTRYTMAVGLGAQYQFKPNAAITGEFIPRLDGYKGIKESQDPRFNTWSLGLLYKIRLHVFQVLISNTQFLHTTQYVAGSSAITENKLFKGGANFHFGFNIIRQFKW